MADLVKFSTELMAVKQYRNGKYLVDSADGFLGFADFWGKDETAKHNAHLFAAAHELYAVIVEDLLPYFEGEHHPDHPSMRRVYEVLAKSRGEIVASPAPTEEKGTQK